VEGSDGGREAAAATQADCMAAATSITSQLSLIKVCERNTFPLEVTGLAICIATYSKYQCFPEVSDKRSCDSWLGFMGRGSSTSRLPHL
jgi:hypothetical protein